MRLGGSLTENIEYVSNKSCVFIETRPKIFGHFAEGNFHVWSSVKDFTGTGKVLKNCVFEGTSALFAEN